MEIQDKYLDNIEITITLFFLSLWNQKLTGRIIQKEGFLIKNYKQI